MKATFDEYKKEIESMIIDFHDNIDLGRVENMMSTMMHKIRRHYNNGRTVKQAVSYIRFKYWT